MQPRRGETGPFELEGQRHGEAAGMRGRQQLLGIRAGLLPEAAAETIGSVLEDRGGGGECPSALAAVAGPGCCGLAHHGGSPPAMVEPQTSAAAAPAPEYARTGARSPSMQPRQGAEC